MSAAGSLASGAAAGRVPLAAEEPLLVLVLTRSANRKESSPWVSG